MENFIVSARKYRPETFTSVVGQASITGTLKSAIQKKQLGHAYLFCGPRGVGKTTCARIFAKTINCMNLGPDSEPCNTCESCLSFNEARAFNIHELDAASNNSVEDIRNLTEQVRIPPQVGKYSIYIIDEVHMLSASAFNAFLKTLEEPPPHAVFILATTEKHKIIPTILSRCQIFDFNRIRVEDIVKYLEFISGEEGVDYEPDAFNVIALKADGAMRDALSIYDQMVSFSGKSISYKDVIENLNILDYEYYFRMTDACLSGESGEVLVIFDEILSRGFDPHNFLSGFSSHLRDLLVCQDEATLKLLEVGAGIRDKYEIQAGMVNQDWLYTALDVIGAADVSFKSSRNQRLHVELSLIKLSRILSDSKKKDLTSKAPSDLSGTTGSKPVLPEQKLQQKPEPEAAQPIPETHQQEPKTDQQEPETHHKEPGTAQPKPEVPEPLSRGLKNVPGSVPSIKDALSGVNYDREPELKATDGSKKTVRSTNFTKEDLLKHWHAYAESIKEEKPRMANSLKNHLPMLGEALQIELVLSNSAQLDEFTRDIKPQLVSYLERALENNQFKLLPIISQEEEQKNALYTSEEKFDHMLKKNPELGKLKDRFNLDFE